LAQRLGLALAAYAALLFAPPFEDAYALPQRLAVSLAAALLALAAPPRLPLGRLALLLLAWLAWRVLSHAVAQPPVPVADWLATQAPLWALLLFGSAALRDPALRRYTAAALLSAAAWVSVLALLPWLGWDPWAAGAVDLGFSQRAHGSLGNPGFLGGWLALLLPLACVVAVDAQGRLRLASLGTLGLMLAALGLTQARASWLAALVGVGLALFLLRPRAFSRRRVLLALLLATAALGVGLAQRQHLSPRLADALDPRSDSWRARAFMAGAAFQLALRHPLVGVGPGGFTQGFLGIQGERLSAGAQHPYRFTHDAHNDWAQLAAESGWLGLLLWAWAWAWALRVAWARAGAEGAAVAGGLAAFAVQACFHFPWAIWPSAAVLMLGLATASAWEAQGAGEERPLSPARAWIAAAVFVPLLALGLRQGAASALLNSGTAAGMQPATQALAAPLFAKSTALAPADARAWQRLGAEHLRQGRLDEAIGAFQGALQALPTQPEAWVNLGLALGQQGSLDAAEQACAQGVALNPRSQEAWANWSKVAWLRGDARGAEARLRQGLQAAGPSVQGSFNLGAILYNERRFAEAAEAFEAVLALQPQHAEAARLLKESRDAR
jgi:tetratricopeptide (TPR) repeat protein